MAGPGTRMLDAGTGPGFVARAAIERGATVTAVDRSSTMVRMARADGIEAIEADVESLPFGDAAFDTVVGAYLLNHLARPRSALAELKRVLAPGGRLALTIWDLPSSNPAIGLFGPVVTELGLTAVVPTGPDPYLYCDDEATAELLAEWDDVSVARTSWSIQVEPGAWFDAVADSTPRTGAVLAQAGPSLRAQARRRYMTTVATAYPPGPRGSVALPATAVLISAARRAGGDHVRP